MRRRSLLGIVLLMGCTEQALAQGTSQPLAEKIEALQRQMLDMQTRMQQEIDALKAQQKKDTEDMRKHQEESTQQVQTVQEQNTERLLGVMERVKIGGYRSLRYENNSLDDLHSTFNFRRFVLTTGAKIAPRLHFYSELEYERFRKLELEQSVSKADNGLLAKHVVSGTNGSEISLEQAWLQYDLTDWVSLRGGAVLVPLGRFNLR